MATAPWRMTALDVLLERLDVLNDDDLTSDGSGLGPKLRTLCKEARRLFDAQLSLASFSVDAASPVSEIASFHKRLPKLAKLNMSLNMQWPALFAYLDAAGVCPNVTHAHVRILFSRILHHAFMFRFSTCFPNLTSLHIGPDHTDYGLSIVTLEDGRLPSLVELVLPGSMVSVRSLARTCVNSPALAVLRCLRLYMPGDAVDEGVDEAVDEEAVEDFGSVLGSRKLSVYVDTVYEDTDMVHLLDSWQGLSLHGCRIQLNEVRVLSKLESHGCTGVALRMQSLRYSDPNAEMELEGKTYVSVTKIYVDDHGMTTTGVDKWLHKRALNFPNLQEIDLRRVMLYHPGAECARNALKQLQHLHTVVWRPSDDMNDTQPVLHLARLLTSGVTLRVNVRSSAMAALVESSRPYLQRPKKRKLGGFATLVVHQFVINDQ